MSFQLAVKAAQDNIDSYVSAQSDPVMYNLNIALLNIARGLVHLEGDVGRLKRQIESLK